MNSIHTSTATLLLLFLTIITTTTSQVIKKGFTATPTSTDTFQPLLTDPTSTFSFGFLPSPPSLIQLSIVHLPSFTPLWHSTPTRWYPSTTLVFNGSLLLLSDSNSTPTFLSTPHISGDLLLLLNTSNLQITTTSPNTVLWQSFDYPSNTIVQDQNFNSNSTLSSLNSRFFMRLDPTFIDLYMNYTGMRQPMYFQHTPLEIRAMIVAGKGPLYIRVNSTGYLGIYQQGSLIEPVAFSTYNRDAKAGFWRLTLEEDGNLRGYYWNSSSWVKVYEAISNTCELPSACGAYGLCTLEGTSGLCQCLDNQTMYMAGSDCFPRETTSLCGDKVGSFEVVRRGKVGLAYKKLLDFKKMGSLDDCEGYCARNCSCWGAIYNNVTQACYVMDFPVETVVEEGGVGRVGYFKVRRDMVVGREVEAWKVVVVVLVLVVVCVVLMGGAWWWKKGREKGVQGSIVEGLAPVQYKGLRDSSSFRSVELSSTSSFDK